MLWPHLYRLISPPGRGARLSVLIFHRVLRQPDPLLPSEPDAREFEHRMRQIGAWFNVLPLAEAIARLQTGTLPARPLAITFDDGYRDNSEVAAPILRRLGLPATFFVSTGFLDGGRMWNDTVIEAVRRYRGGELDLDALGLGRHATATVEDKRQTIDVLLLRLKYLEDARRLELEAAIAETCGASLPDDLMMSSAQVRGLHAAGMTIGAHTVNHPILARVDDARARREIADGRDRLEAIVGAKVALFAYPNGKPDQDYRAEHVAMAKQLGFDAAVSTAWGVATATSDRYQIPRFTPWDRGTLKYAARLAQNIFRPDYATA